MSSLKYLQNTETLPPPAGSLLVTSNFSAVPSGYVKVNAVYNQADYPNLYNRVGLINASPWAYRATHPLTSATTLIKFANNIWIYTGGGSVSNLATSTDVITWTVRSPLITQTIHALTYGNDRWVYGGNTGPILTGISLDNGVTWERTMTSGTSTAISSIAHGNNTYVLGGASNLLRTSTNGFTWTSRTVTSITINDLVYGGAVYVAVGNGGQIRTSTDAVTWTSRTSNTTSNLNSIIYANNLYVAVGNNRCIVTSTDGTAWTLNTSGLQSTFTSNDIVYTNGLYIVGGDASGSKIYTSTNAVTWATPNSGRVTSAVTTLAASSDKIIAVWGNNFAMSTAGTNWDLPYMPVNNVTGAAYESGLYIRALTDIPSIGGSVQTSTDLINWTTKISGDNSLKKLRFLEKLSTGEYVASGEYASTGPTGAPFYSSSDSGVTWVSPDLFSSPSRTILAVTYGFVGGIGNRYILAGETPAGQSAIRQANSLTSQEFGIPGNPQTTATVYDVKYYNNVFVLAESSGNIRTTTDFITYTTRASVGTTLTKIRYLNNVYIAVGLSGAMRTSTDLITWTARNTGTTQEILDISYLDNLWVIYGTLGMFRTSTNLIAWNAITSNTSSDIAALLYDGTKYIYFGKPVTNFSSSLSTWNSITLPSSSRITYNNDRFHLIGPSGLLRTSTDGFAWTTLTSMTTSTINSVTFGNGLYLYGGSGGAINQSSDGVNWGTGIAFTSSLIRGIAYGNGLYVYVGNGGVAGYSANGLTWTAITTLTSQFSTAIREVIYDGTRFIAVGNGAGPFIATSTNASSWTVNSFGISTVPNTINYLNGLYIIGGSSGVLATSTDLVTWTQRVTNTTRNIGNISYGNGRYVFVGDAVTTGTSTDAINWSIRSAGDPGTVAGVTFGNGIFAAIGSNINTSTDGFNVVSYNGGGLSYNPLTQFYIPNFSVGTGNTNNTVWIKT